MVMKTAKIYKELLCNIQIYRLYQQEMLIVGLHITSNSFSLRFTIVSVIIIQLLLGLMLDSLVPILLIGNAGAVFTTSTNQQYD